MRLDEPIEESGFFWLPEEPEVRVPGDLHISESGEARLEVRLDSISPGWEDVINARGSADDYDVSCILGMGDSPGRITLVRCFMANAEVRGMSARLTMRAEMAFTGHHYKVEEDATFTEFTFSVEGIDEWLGISGIDVQYDDETMRTSSVHIRVPDNISIGLPDGLVLTFVFGMTFPSLTRTITEAHATQKAYVSLLTNEPKPLEYFTSLALKLRNFLRLAIGQPVSIGSTTGYSAELTRPDGFGGEYQCPIRVYYRDGGSPGSKQDVRWFHMLFSYQDVENQLEAILAKWLQSYEVFEPTLNVYFTSMSDTSQYLEIAFLQRVQGIETLHRRSSQETEMPEDEFDEIKKSLLMHCPSNRREWLERVLAYGNGLSLRRRLRAMMDPFERFFGDNRQQQSFINRVVVTRNYLTHYDSSIEDQVVTGMDLWRLTVRLEALFQLHLLQFIGFDAERIDRVLQGGSNLRMMFTRAGLDMDIAHRPRRP